jgi:hypothetical protein
VEAMKDLNSALEEDPEHLYALIHRSHLFLLQGDFEKAKMDLNFMKEMFEQQRVSEEWTREQVKYVSERAKFIFNAIAEHEAVSNEKQQEKEEREKSNSTFRIFKKYDLKKLVKRLKGITGNLLNKGANEEANAKDVKAKLGSSRISPKTKNILQEVHEKEEIENYKLALARCLSHLNFTIDDIMDRRVPLNDPQVKFILSYIPLGWYNDEPLDQILEDYLWDRESSLVIPQVLKFKNFFSDNPIEEFGYLFELILKDEEFIEIILESSKHSQVQDFKKYQAKEIIQSKVQTKLLNMFKKDEELLAYIHYEFIKLVILEEKIQGDMTINQRIARLFKILQNCNNMEHEIQDENEHENKEKEVGNEGPESSKESGVYHVKSLFYVTDKKYSYFGSDVVKLSIEGGSNAPVEFQFSGEAYEQEMSWDLSDEQPEIKLLIEIQGLMMHERVAIIETKKLKRNRMNYFDIEKKEELDPTIPSKRSGSIGLYIAE